MARKLRIQYPGAIYHVMSRGDRREDIFLDDQDREGLLATLGEACEKTGWQVHAYCLMSNYFHLLVETPQANLSDGMKWWLQRQLQTLPANAPAKMQLARRLRRETTLSLRWIAQQLGVGSWKYLSNLLGEETPPQAQPELGLGSPLK